MGALVTLDLQDRSSSTDLPWIITFGPLDEDEEWEPVVCGPYERPHALALAEAVVTDDDLMAVVEPLLPRLSVADIRAELAQARRGAMIEPATGALFPSPDDDLIAPADLLGPAGPARRPSAETREVPDDGSARPVAPPAPDDVRAGFARIAARLTAVG